ncbi:hypothetical protein BBJ28_00003852 [Nothophytophthora sp. Chile5]|nr:hypothetical protein BBJ28_00003852 [Nothophytophthora sp. Chile5]
MNILDVDLPPSGQDGDDEGAEDHPLLRLHVSSSSLHDASDDGGALPANDGGEYVPQQPHDSLRSANRQRRKIGKGIQLILLRKYVQCAKQFNRLPDRLTTEQLLEQGYDEFYYQGGNLNEPRLTYAAFLKLVRNRRSEVARQTRGVTALSHSRGGTRRNQKEQLEIRALIDELEHVRHGQMRGTLDYDALGTGSAGNDHMHAVASDASVPILSDSSSIIGDAGADSGVSAGDLTTAESYSSVLSGASGGTDDIVVSRTKLDMMLRVAQETLLAQKKILEEVRAIEQRIAGIH